MKNTSGVYENTSIGLYRTTPEGKIILANQALIKMLGYNNFDELAQLNLEKEGFEIDMARSEFRDMIERDGSIKGLESAWIHKDGRRIYIRENATVFRDSGGKTLYYQGTVENITDKKQAEILLFLTHAQKRSPDIH